MEENNNDISIGGIVGAIVGALFGLVNLEESSCISFLLCVGIMGLIGYHVGKWLQGPVYALMQLLIGLLTIIAQLFIVPFSFLSKKILTLLEYCKIRGKLAHETRKLEKENKDIEGLLLKKRELDNAELPLEKDILTQRRVIDLLGTVEGNDEDDNLSYIRNAANEWNDRINELNQINNRIHAFEEKLKSIGSNRKADFYDIRRHKKRVIACILLIIGVLVGVAYYIISNINYKSSVVEERKKVASSYDAILPIYSGKRYEWIESVKSVTLLEELSREYKQNKKIYNYEEWVDHVNVTFVADDLFEKADESDKLKYLQDLHDILDEKAIQVLKDTSPLYCDFFYKSWSPGDEVLTRRIIDVYILSSGNRYEYHQDHTAHDNSYLINGEKYTPIE